MFYLKRGCHLVKKCIGGKIEMKIGKIIKIILFTMIFFILQSCVKIETSMNINSDLSGISTSEVSIMKNLMPEEQLKKERRRT